MRSSKSARRLGRGADRPDRAAPDNDLITINAGRLPRRLTMITLGVADVPASRSFYERLGFKAADFKSDKVCFFETNGSILSLYGHEALADDAAVAADAAGFRGVTCAINLDSEAAVDAAFELVLRAGGRITKPAEKVFWGDYSGYFSDPDGHLWEVAFNPLSQLGADGSLHLPPPA